MSDDEAALRMSIIDLARQYGRYGYRRITALLRAEGWSCNHKRVERIWRAEGLKVPARQPKRGRLWMNDGSCVRLRPERPNHVWGYDFVEYGLGEVVMAGRGRCCGKLAGSWS
jgi:putative transposase